MGRNSLQVSSDRMLVQLVTEVNGYRYRVHEESNESTTRSFVLVYMNCFVDSDIATFKESTTTSLKRRNGHSLATLRTFLD